MDASPKETSMVGGIGGGRVGEMNFVWRPVDPCDHASCTNPCGQKEFCRLHWGGRAAGQMVTKNRSGDEISAPCCGVFGEPAGQKSATDRKANVYGDHSVPSANEAQEQ